jgi:zinc protease
MKHSRLATTLATALLLATWFAFAQEATPNHTATPGIPASWKQVPIPALPPFHPREPRRLVLKNGMIVFLAENHELPLISGTAMIRGGSDSEPAEKTGLVELYAESWRTGGTGKLTGDQLDDLLEARAAKVESAPGDSDTSLSFNCLKADLPAVLDVFTALLRTPAFREEKLKLAKKQMYSGISRRNDDSGEIASMQADILAYGRQSAYARVPEYATVASVTREDLLAWHSSHATPNNIILGITGDFDPAQMETALRKAFDDWASGPKVEETRVEITPAAPGLYLVDKTDVNQSEIRMVSLGIERRNPDYFAVQVMNDLFGGGFSSRLFQNLRTKAGLAYAVGGGVGSQWDHAGLTQLEIGTKTETTVEAIQGLWQQVDELKTNPPTELELRRAKDSILNSFIFNFDTPAKVLREQQTYAFYGYPADFLEKYRSAVEKVTAEDVIRVANKYVHKNELKVLVVGNAAEFKDALARLGPVTPVDISIPPPPKPRAATTTPAAGNSADAKAAIARLTEALGGTAPLTAVKSLRQSMSLTQQGQQMKVEQSIVYPDKQAQKISTPQGEVLEVITPAAAFVSMGGRSQDLPPSQRDAQLEGLKHDFINVLQHSGDPKYTLTAAGKEKLGEVEATVVDVQADGVSARWWIAPDGRLLQEQFTETGQNGPQNMLVKYSEWKPFGGLQYPTHWELASDGAPLATVTLESMEVNPAVDPKLFEKPQP